MKCKGWRFRHHWTDWKSYRQSPYGELRFTRQKRVCVVCGYEQDQCTFSYTTVEEVFSPEEIERTRKEKEK